MSLIDAFNRNPILTTEAFRPLYYALALILKTPITKAPKLRPLQLLQRLVHLVQAHVEGRLGRRLGGCSSDLGLGFLGSQGLGFKD